MRISSLAFSAIFFFHPSSFQTLAALCPNFFSCTNNTELGTISGFSQGGVWFRSSEKLSKISKDPEGHQKRSSTSKAQCHSMVIQHIKNLSLGTGSWKERVFSVSGWGDTSYDVRFSLYIWRSNLQWLFDNAGRSQMSLQGPADQSVSKHLHLQSKKGKLHVGSPNA